MWSPWLNRAYLQILAAPPWDHENSTMADVSWSITTILPESREGLNWLLVAFHLVLKKQSYQSWSSTQLGGQQKLKPYISWSKRMQILSVDPHLPASPSRYPAKSLWPALSWIISLQWSKLTRNKLIWVWVTNGGRQWAHQNDHLEMQIVNHPLLSSIYDLAHTGPITIYSKYHITYI